MIPQWYTILTDQIRTAILQIPQQSLGDIITMRDLKISIDKSGEMTFTETTYDAAAVLASYEDIDFDAHRRYE